MTTHSKIGILLTMILLAGCEQPPQAAAAVTNGNPSPQAAADSPAANHEQVAPRATARWEQVLAQEYAAAYDYFSRGTRAILPLEIFIQRSRGGVARYQEAELVEQQCEKQLCRLKFDLKYVYIGPTQRLQGLEMNTTFTETWRYEGGEWWLVQL